MIQNVVTGLGIENGAGYTGNVLSGPLLHF